MTVTISEKASINNIDHSKEHKNSYVLPIAFQPFKDKKIWLASNIDKKPICPSSGTSDKHNQPEHWETYDEVERFITNHPDHTPAIVISKESGLVVIDLDKVIDTQGNVTPWAQKILNQLPEAYIEKSSSGEGFHIIMRGSKPSDKKVKKFEKNQKLEMYGFPDISLKPIKLTGWQCNQCEKLTDLSPVIATIYNEHWPEDISKERDYADYKKSPFLSDEEVIYKIQTASKVKKFNKLFIEGDLSDYENDPSSAEQALCNFFAFYTQDTEQIDRLIRSSQLFKEAKKIRISKNKPENKWEDREDYRVNTIDKALSTLTTTWQPKQMYKTFVEQEKSTWNNPERLEDIESLELSFPLNDLPTVLKDAIEEVARDTKTDPALSCHPALGITALMIGKKAFVIEKQGLKHHPSLLLVGVAPSGERKSSCYDGILGDIKEEIDKEVEEHEKRKTTIKAHNEIIRDEILSIKSDVKTTKIKAEEAKKLLEELYKSEQQYPAEPFNFGDDITPERLFQKLYTHKGSYGVFSSDARSIFKKIIGKKDGDSGESIYIGGMWGDDLSRSRVGNNKGDVGGEDILIRKPALTTVAFIQPDLWEELSKDRRMRDSGLISRICLVIPKSQMGTRFETADDLPLDKTKIKPFTEAVLRLRKWNPDKPIGVSLSPEATKARREFYNTIEKELIAGGKFEDVRDIATKATSITARLALILSCLVAAENPTFNGTIPPISGKNWLAAQVLEEYYLAQAIDAQRTHGKSGTVHLMQKIMLWLKNKVLQSVGTELVLVLASEISKGIRGTNTEEVLEIIPMLESKSWIRKEKKVRGGAFKYEVNKRICDDKQ